MNEVNERKVLISVKVSTLLLIVLAIIVLAVVGGMILNNTKEEQKQVSEKISNTTISTEIVKDNSETALSDVHLTSDRNVVVTSRSSNTREAIPTGEIQPVVQAEEIIEEPEVITTPIEEVTISRDMDLTVRTGLSRDDFILLISGVEQDTSSFFEENAGLIYDLCEKYQLNEIFFCGLISAESGWSIASNHRNTHNYISLMSYNGLIKYSSVEEGLEKAAEALHNNYLTPGGKFYYGSTLAGMKTKFCPASSTWVNLVYGRMEQILN